MPAAHPASRFALPRVVAGGAPDKIRCGAMYPAVAGLAKFELMSDKRSEQITFPTDLFRFFDRFPNSRSVITRFEAV
ncbi:hypothetical protein IY145_11405 [Methylosinus sp. H3A]|uniref:hypothetical protein n=1 Tax=Methylosinus sp. H3A TaxID=2785786 RepID=UPI0018C29C2F|nr:hypothetical protein [Methylosinus sp. H3A]MBG0809985.1 hypothetical protein [Methylosinus sp. H3A]